MRVNAQARQVQCYLDILSGAGAYADLQEQILHDLGVFAQITAAATEAWKALPYMVAGDKLPKLLQGPSEPFQDYVDRLLQLALG